MEDVVQKSVLKNKNYLLLFQGTLTSNIAANLYSFALSFYILAITGNNALIQGAYLAMCGITFVVFSFVGGIIADRFDKVKLVYGLDFLKGFIILICIIPLYFCIRNDNTLFQVVILFIVGFLNGVIGAIFNPASQALIPEIVEPQLLQQANSYFSVLSSFVSIIGILLAGVLYSYVPLIVMFIIVGVCYVLSGVSELFIKSPRQVTATKLTWRSMITDFKEGLAYLWPMKTIVYLIFGILFINFFFTPFNGNVIPYLINTKIATQDYMLMDIIQPEMWSSIFVVAFSVGSIVTGIIIGKMRQKEKCGVWINTWMLLTGAIVCLLTLSYYLFADQNINALIIAIIVGFVALGITIICINVPISTVIQKSVAPDKMAKVWSLINIGSQGLCPIASLLAGIIISGLGLGPLMIVCSLGFVVTAILMACSRRIRAI